jgi:hypothetical protein
MAAEFFLSASYVKVSLTGRKILQHGIDGFPFPQKEVVLRIFIALKIPSLSAGFEPSKLGSLASTII